MNRLTRLLAGISLIVLAAPTSAFAYENQITPFGLHVTVSAVGLFVAVLLLIEALGLRRVSLGGVIAEKLHLVVLAVIALAASALAKWTSNFVSGITFEQTELASEMLVALAMALIAGYFYSVRTAMQSYIASSKNAPGDGADAQPAIETQEDARV